MTKLEMDLWQSIPSTEFNTFWVPCTWFINLLREARNECRITDAQGVKLILEVTLLQLFTTTRQRGRYN